MLIIATTALLAGTLAVALTAASGPAVAMAAYLEGGTIGGVLGALIVLALPDFRREE